MSSDKDVQEIKAHVVRLEEGQRNMAKGFERMTESHEKMADAIHEMAKAHARHEHVAEQVDDHADRLNDVEQTLAKHKVFIGILSAVFTAVLVKLALSGAGLV